MSRGRTDIAELLTVMARLRDPEGGCPWDLEQDFATIAPYTIEEAYEVAEAIEHGDRDELREELGDLLFQVVYHAQMAREAGWFGFEEVVAAIVAKMIRRHPHVFADQRIATAEEQTGAWERHKAREKPGRRSLLDGVSAALPALTRAVKLQRRAARAGFDWPEAGAVLEKIEEELAELRAELDADEGTGERVAEEMGDLLFAVANLARHLKVDPEQAARAANRKFERRFRALEQRLRRLGREPAELPLAELDELWEEVKREER